MQGSASLSASTVPPAATAELPFDLVLAERHRTLFLLDAKIAAARSELERLDGQGERRDISRHEARLVQINERLIVSALDARAEAQAVREDLGALARISQRDTLTDLPNRGLTLDRLETAIASAHRHDRRLAVLFVAWMPSRSSTTRAVTPPATGRCRMRRAG